MFPRFVIGLVLPLLLPILTIWFSLDHKRNVSDGVVSRIGRKWKRPDPFDSNSVALMTPLTTKIFDFHKVISALMTLLTTPTPSLVKSSLYLGQASEHWVVSACGRHLLFESEGT